MKIQDKTNLWIQNDGVGAKILRFSQLITDKTGIT